MRRENLIGNKYGYLTVDEMLFNYKGNKTYCKCHCDCGKDNVVTMAYEIKRRKFPSCGCQRRKLSIENFGKDINGKKFNRLKVLETLWDEKPAMVKCLCDCGKIVILNKNDVQCGHTKSCGCLQSEMASKANTVDYTGMVSNYDVTILKRHSKNDKGQWLWECKCKCGNTFIDIPARVLNGHVRSCGCLLYSSREELIKNYLDSNRIDYIQQYSYQDCISKNGYRLRFDFAILNNGKVFCLIEYDGEQHFHPVEVFGGEDGFQKTVDNDSIKNEYCKCNNIPLFRLPYKLTDAQIIEKITNIIYP